MGRPGSGLADHVVSAAPPVAGGSRRAPRSLRRTTGMGPFRTVPTSLIELIGGAAGAHGHARASLALREVGLDPAVEDGCGGCGRYAAASCEGRRRISPLARAGSNNSRRVTRA